MSAFDPVALALPHVARLEGYAPGHQPQEEGWTKLNTNENPYPPAPSALARIAAAATRLRLYPDPRAARLRQAIAEHHGVSPGQVLAANGSDEVLQLLARAFLGPDAPAGYAWPGYSLYPVLADMQDAPRLTVEFDRSFQLPVARIAASPAPVFFLTSPHAPTGVGFRTEEIAAVAAGFRGLLVVDEAYAAFAAEDAVPLLARHGNVCIVRSLSKAYALAGLRAGYLLGPARLVELLDRLRDSYNVDGLAQAVAEYAIHDRGYFSHLTGLIRSTRDRCRDRLRDLGWRVYPSQANFLFTEPADARGRTGPEVAQACCEHLRAARILVRHFPGHPLTAPCLRVSIGTDEQMELVFSTLQAWQHRA